MMHSAQIAATDQLAINIGGMAIGIRTGDPDFRRMLVNRYAGFVSALAAGRFEFNVEIVEPSRAALTDDDLRVTRQGDRWLLQRGDFYAWWSPQSGCGYIRQSRNPYAIDSVLRIVHTLMLARQGGFLVHAASAIREGKAFMFAGVSGAGKTTISRLAPPGVKLLTDEISYVSRDGTYHACGTPFAGELARVGENEAAPLKTLFFLQKGPENRIEDIGVIEAVRLLLRNILFFAEDPELVELVFASACEFANLVPIRRLIFVPEERVWDIIR